MKKLSILVALVALIAACNPYGSEIPTRLVGNYHDINNREWVLGLYEEFAIYHNDFWNYESVSDNQIALSKKSGEKITLNLKSFDEWGEGESKVFSMFVNGRQVSRYYNESAMKMSLMQEWTIGRGAWDSTTFKKHEYRIDTAVVRLYLRNTAHGASALARRELNRPNDMQVFNYLESKNVTALPLDSTDHYGYCYEFKIPVTGVSELPLRDLFGTGDMGWNSFAGQILNYIVEPGDTLMFYAYEDYLALSATDAYGFKNCSGGSWVYNSERTFIERPEPTAFTTEDFKNGRRYSRKYMDLNTIKRRYLDLSSIDPKSDTLKSVFPINEDEIFSTVTAYNFVINYIKQNADSLPSSPENLAQHPDWIVAENSNGDGAILLDTDYIKSLELSDDFVEFYRLMHAVQFYDDFSPITSLTDLEKQNILQNIKRADYKAYFEDKMKK